jgi:hypothetical protein
MQVADIDVKKVSPIGHGKCICFSVYCGYQADFGNGQVLCNGLTCCIVVNMSCQYFPHFINVMISKITNFNVSYCYFVWVMGIFDSYLYFLFVNRFYVKIECYDS